MLVAPDSLISGAPLSATTQQARDNLQQQLQQQLGQPQSRTQVLQVVHQSQPSVQTMPSTVTVSAPPSANPLQPLPPIQPQQQQITSEQQQQQQQQPKKGLSLTVSRK